MRTRTSSLATALAMAIAPRFIGNRQEHEHTTSQPDCHGNHGRQNWLPAPKEGFRFTARFYGPSTSPIGGTYDTPGVVRVD